MLNDQFEKVENTWTYLNAAIRFQYVVLECTKFQSEIGDAPHRQNLTAPGLCSKSEMPILKKRN